MPYAKRGHLPVIAAFFLGVKATFVILMVQALLRLAGKILHRADHWFIALASFLALYAFEAPFPVVVIMAATYGLIRQTSAGQETTHNTPHQTILRSASLRRTFARSTVWLILWVTPIALAVALETDILAEIGAFF
ncbi:chromate transporter [uncultured Aliiroseovarius sp.]|uniref:chromate transporter n=1 Tax=uncultured Aliiroseovarius sp. TaxID=1658783 RepID=UPI002599D370|nr:chromate transporter [uncultured Aliiroseovarius sp.]